MPKFCKYCTFCKSMNKSFKCISPGSSLQRHMSISDSGTHSHTRHWVEHHRELPPSQELTFQLKDTKRMHEKAGEFTPAG